MQFTAWQGRTPGSVIGWSPCVCCSLIGWRCPGDIKLCLHFSRASTQANSAAAQSDLKGKLVFILYFCPPLPPCLTVLLVSSLESREVSDCLIVC